jgi:hypothetical protein
MEYENKKVPKGIVKSPWSLHMGIFCNPFLMALSKRLRVMMLG